jgi:hypothetical protein
MLPVALSLTAAGMAAAQSPLPNPTLTPGAIDPNVTQANIETTICVRGWCAFRWKMIIESGGT